MKRFELIALVAGKPDLADELDVQTVAEGNYFAVLSKRARPAIALPQSRRTALQHAAQRQAILEALQEKGTVFVARSEQWLTPQQARDVICSNPTVLADLHTWLTRKVQFQVNVSWEAAEVLARFRSSAELAPVFKSDHISAEALTKAVTVLRARLVKDIQRHLAPVIRDLVTLPTTADMLCNLVVLIDQETELQLDHAVEAIEAIWPEGLMIRQIGPSPAGSFALLNLEWVSSADVQAAYGVLGLKTGHTVDDLRRARRAALKTPNADATVIQKATRIVEVSRAVDPDQGLHLIEILAEDKGLSTTALSAVA